MTPQPLNSEPTLGPVEGRGVAEIRALCDAATPGPWSFYLGDLWAGATADELATADRLSAEHVFSDEAEDIFERASHLFHGDPVRPEDAEFIAAARDLVPSLLAEVEAAHRFERSAAVEREALLAERDSLRGVVQAVAQLHRRIVLSNGVEVDYCACGKRNCSTVVALAAAADAPQPPKRRREQPLDERCIDACCDLGKDHAGDHYDGDDGKRWTNYDDYEDGQ